MHPIRKPAVRLILMIAMFSMLQCCCCIIPIRWRVQSGVLSNNPPAYVIRAVEEVQSLKYELPLISLDRPHLSR
jgi:hypothetical protein